MKAVFESVLAMSLSAGFLAAVVMVLRWCFRKSPKWVHCALWALVAVRLLVPALPKTDYSMVPQRVSDPDTVAALVEEIPAFVPPAPVREAPAPQAPEAPAPPAQPEKTKAAVDWMTVLAWVWLGGVGAMGTYGLFSYLRIRRQVAASVDIGNRVNLCDYIDTPFILGLIRPRIYLPSQLDSKTASYVLAHEQAHLRRRDHWWKPLGFALLSVHWFNPMIWAAYVLLCRDIEMACDQAVVRTMSEEQKMHYSGALLRCSVPRQLVSICPLAFGEVGVRARIQSVLRYRRPALWLTLAGVAAVIGGAVLFLTDPLAGDVEYFETACYCSEGDILILTDYDRQHREVKYTQYQQGVLQYQWETDYAAVGDGQLRTVTYSVSPDTTQIVSPEDGIDVNPGETFQLQYRETLDENGSVIHSSCLGADKEETSEYDADGNLVSRTASSSGGSSQVRRTYDPQGNLLTEAGRWERVGIPGTSTRETRYAYDGQGNVTGRTVYYDGVLTVEEATVWNDDGRKRSTLRSGLETLDSTLSYSYDETGLVETCQYAWPDGSVYKTVVNTYDAHGNLLSHIFRENGVEQRFYYNYLGSDGTKSIGIPRELYTPGQPVSPHPSPEQVPGDTVLLEVQDVTPTGCILKVRINPKAYDPQEFQTGQRFTLARKVGQSWKPVPKIKGTDLWDPQPMGQLPLVEGYFTADLGLSWSRAYGILPPGDYRLTTYLRSDSPQTVEFTVEANSRDNEEVRIQACMDALNALVTGEHYAVETQASDGTREVHARSGMDYLYAVYANGESQEPVSGEMRYHGISYRWLLGCWAVNESGVSPSLMEWYEEFVFGHEELYLLRSSERFGIPFGVEPRPNRELAQRDHKVTFFLNQSGRLTAIREEGIITEYNGQTVEQPYSRTLTVVSTDPSISENQIALESNKLNE
ncbi:MAG: M56 family metallopeptidase [Eubacteriales bacterium]|nr:M56 family metallopeptidase [Eubacteriales bacterium]